jgi:ribosomal protein L11 methyltransferase
VSGAGQAASDDGNAPTVIIHDGRHLPETRNLKTIEIEIDAHLAFGTGTHETTRMVCAELINYFTFVGNAAIEGNLPIRVLDCGTGTGILAICALKLGAAEAVGYDIDEWAVDNARHNAVINQVDDRFSQLLGDASLLNNVEGVFQVVTANINRNILLADLPAFRSKLADGGMLILSGFYTADIPLLIERAAALGLTLLHQRQDNDWACLTLVSRESRG